MDLEKRRDVEDQRDHELELARINNPEPPESPWSAWAGTAQTVLVWALILASICYLASIGAIN